MKTLKAFLLGMLEFRQGFTSRVELQYTYDQGREWAHRLTFRHYED